MASGIGDASNSIVNDLGGLETALGNIDKVLEKLTASAAKFSAAMKASTGGVSNPSSFSNGGVGRTGSNFLNPYMGQVAPFMQMNSGRALFSSILGSAAKIGGGLLGGGVAALPDVAATMGMAQGLYHAGMYSSTNWGRVGTATFSYLQGGMNMAGAQGVVAASLAGQGMQFGGGGLYGGAGMYASTARSVAGAARMLNISNDAAAQGIGSTYSGSTSMALLQNMGIYTTGPTGKSATPTQILAMVNARLTGNGSMSYKQLQTALGPGGLMTQNLENSGLSPEMQQMARAYMLQAAKGNPINFDDPNSAAAKKAIKEAGGNPEAASMAVQGSVNGTMQAASGAYVKGMNDATSAVVSMQNAITGLVNGPLKSFAQALGAYGLAQQGTALPGAMTAGAGILSGLGQLGGGIMNWSATNKTLKGAGVEGAGTGSRILRGLKTGLKGGAVSLGASLVGEGIKGISGNQQGSVGNKVGNALSTAGQWAGMASWLNAFGPEVGVPAMAAAGIVGGVVGAFSGGTKSTVNTGGLTDTTGGLKLVAPVRGPVTTKYGQKTDVHGNALWGGDAHKAIDYGVSEGTVVQAAAGGTVATTGAGSGDRSYGNYIIIDHGGGYSTLYAHLSSIGVRSGDKVVQGQQIGLSGATGYVTGPHLHFETRKNGQKINPAGLGLGPAVAVVAGNPSTTASSNSDGSIGGYNGPSGGSGATAGVVNLTIPGSYKGASYGKVSGMATASYSRSGGSSSMQGASGQGSSPMGGQGGPGLTLGKEKNNVVINLTIAQASEAEAKKLATMVKTYLEDDHLYNSMGRM